MNGNDQTVGTVQDSCTHTQTDRRTDHHRRRIQKAKKKKKAKKEEAKEELHSP